MQVLKICFGSYLISLKHLKLYFKVILLTKCIHFATFECLFATPESNSNPENLPCTLFSMFWCTIKMNVHEQILYVRKACLLRIVNMSKLQKNTQY